MLDAAQRLGFSARGVKGSYESLSRIPLPAVAHVVLAAGYFHFVVIVGVSPRYIRIMDPADGRIHKVPRERFVEQWSGVLVILVPSESFQPGNMEGSVWIRFLQLLKPHRAILLQALFGAVLYTVLGLSLSVFVQKIIDHVLPSGNTNLLNLMGSVLLVLLIVQAFINHIKGVLTLRSGQLIDARLILAYYRHLFRLPQSFVDSMRTGELVSRVNDAFKIRVFINDVLVGVGVNLCMLLFSFGLMFTYYWKLALLILLIVPLYASVYLVSNSLNRKTQRRIMEESAELESQLVSSLQAASTIRQSGVEDFVGMKTEAGLVRFLRTSYASSLNALWAGNGSEFISSLFKVLLLWAGAAFVLEREMTPGELLSFFTLLNYFTAPVARLVEMNQTLQDALIAAGRLFEIMDLEPDSVSRQAQFSPEKAGPICFNNITFRYGTRSPVFRGLTLRIPEGEITALVGESGSGKSTLSSLLLGIYAPESGTITINGMNIRHVDPQRLRRIVGIVPQQIHLLPGSLLENIAMGEYAPDMERVLYACKGAGMMDFLETLPLGLHTGIGEGGTRLSGGQRQRVAIARVLYRNPQVLVLDEATASLDAVAESRIQNTFFSLRDKGKTILIITHRLPAIQEADRIVVLGRGGVVETGRHLELLGQKGPYYRLWQRQTANLE